MAEAAPWHELPPAPAASAARQATTALRWVARCCPGLPLPRLHRLFRRRHVRMRVSEQERSRRVGEAALLPPGAVLCVPASLALAAVPDPGTRRREMAAGTAAQEMAARRLRERVLYRDAAVVAMDKPRGMAVQGGTGVVESLDDGLMAQAMASFGDGDAEPPRLVHRLDKDTTGVLLLGRTRDSAAMLHSLFRDKGAGSVERRYWALVLGEPKERKGRISAPLARLVLHGGASDRIVVRELEEEGDGRVVAQSAVTEYRVLGPSLLGCTWLELRPLTGRKHQLRVHCAQVLGAPVVGDYRYGWRAHREWDWDRLREAQEMFGEDREKGDLLSAQPWLHLHCRETAIPDVAALLRGADMSQAEELRFVAPLPPHMQATWNFTLPKGLSPIKSAQEAA